MSPRLLYLLQVARRREDKALKAGRVDPLPWSDSVDLACAEWAGYGVNSVGESMMRRGR